MIELEKYFNKVCFDDIKFSQDTNGFVRWGDRLIVNKEGEAFPKIDKSIEIAIIGVEEDRNAINNKGCSLSANKVREYFYQLYPQDDKIKIIDLGNLKQGNQVKDTYFALADVMKDLFERMILPIVIGGSNDVAIGAYKGYANIGQIINIFNLDARFDLISDTEPTTNENFLHEILCSEPNYLFDYTHAGYQTYFVDNNALKLLDNLRFERLRLGEIQSNLEAVEPMVRDADMVMIDMNCVRASDSPCSSSPHGLYGEQLCKIVNYAGMSDKLSSICFFENNPTKDVNDRSSQIIAHSLYYFIDGYLWRKNDFPYRDKENYYKFNVLIDNEDIVFYKSKKSDRWWVEVPCSSETRIKYLHHYLVPCTYQDYVCATNGEVPDRWLIAYKKMNL
ncbi:MAG: formimidoylglutamase [Bacteroidales bacterium]|jgi:formiminoglutamase|nr:formimidoylglutamase [Bacteroidales bacterium]